MQEVSAYAMIDMATGFSSPLKFVAAGFRSDAAGSQGGAASDGLYWTSSVSGTNAVVIYFNAALNSLAGTRAFGLSVRCIKD